MLSGKTALSLGCHGRFVNINTICVGAVYCTVRYMGTIINTVITIILYYICNITVTMIHIIY